MYLTYKFVPFEVFIPTVMAAATCERHNAKFGEPCFVIHADHSNKKTNAICGSRARKAGMNGEISPGSLSMSGGYRK